MAHEVGRVSVGYHGYSFCVSLSGGIPRNILPLSCRPLPPSVLLESAVGLPLCVQSAGETPPTNEI